MWFMQLQCYTVIKSNTTQKGKAYWINTNSRQTPGDENIFLIEYKHCLLVELLFWKANKKHDIHISLQDDSVDMGLELCQGDLLGGWSSPEVSLFSLHFALCSFWFRSCQNAFYAHTTIQRTALPVMTNILCFGILYRIQASFRSVSHHSDQNDLLPCLILITTRN